MSNSSSQQGLGQTSLLLSYASKGDVNAIKQLLEEGASVNASDYDGRTALHLAASEGHGPVVELLLNNGADVNPVDRWGDTPLADARKYAKGAVSKILEQHGARIEDKKKHEPLYDVDPTEQYEIDRSELEPMDHIPPLYKSASEEFRVVNWRGTKVVARTLQSPQTTDPDFFNKLKMELLMLERMRHPNIVQFLGAVTKSIPPVIVTEYLPRGNLHDFISKGRIPPKRALGFALDIARYIPLGVQGINYLHEHREAVIHGNLNPRNLLQNEAGQLKVLNFALLGSKLHTVLSNGGEISFYEYMAPELYKKEAFDKSVDTYAFGFILHEMFEGPQNLEGLSPEEMARKRAYDGVHPGFTASTYPVGMRELIAECWHKDRSKRPSFSDIIKRLEDMKVNNVAQRCECVIL